MADGELWWNVFASKACMFLRALGSVMVLIVLSLIGLTYYTTVVLVYQPLARDDGADGTFARGVLVAYHFLIFMVLWSYFACVLTEPGRVPDGWQPPPEPESEDEAENGKGGWEKGRQLSNSEKLRRFCRKCTAWKPERCHHCSVCGRCVLKMDHHCVWVANCVGAYNYKFFLLFLLYTFVATVFDAVVLLSNFVDFFKDLEANGDSPGSGGGGGESSDASAPARARQGGAVAAVFVTFVLDVAFAASLLGFIIMHANLNLSNMTTIEMYEKKKTLPWRYNLGQRKNFEEVFGKSAWWWLIPAHSADQLRRLLDISRVSGGTYPDMESDGLDRDAGPTVGGQESTGLDGGGTCGTCV
tara:strand:- start:437 stop:1507 length:1071 start_codon:yes stop_codon:yes gene_type:complete